MLCSYKLKRRLNYLICIVLLLCLSLYFYSSTLVLTRPRVVSLTGRFTQCDNALSTYITATPNKHLRLGNLMFIYATLLGFQSRHCNITLAATRNSKRWLDNMSSVFKLNTASSIKSVDFLLNKTTFMEQAPMKYDTSFETILPITNYSFSGYFQSWKYFRNITNQVKNQFQFHACILDAAKKFHSQLNGSSPVCIHIRNTPEYGQVPMEFIWRTMKYFKDKYTDKKLTFVIVSDNTKKAWMDLSGSTKLPLLDVSRSIFSLGHLCGEAAKYNHSHQSILYGKKKYGGSDIVFSNGHTAAEDLAILSLCPYNVVTTGTFGWWGAYLSGGETVYWKLFPKPSTKLYHLCNQADYYPPHWIPLS